jgi:cation transport regulator ChaB
MSNGQAPSPTSTTPAEDSENLQDMWDEPLEVAMDTWAVTRCLNDYGKKETRWSAGHFVAVAMWSGGLEAGIQAAKAIRIFGLWSPHADDEDEALPAWSNETRREWILEKLWPIIQTNQTTLLQWARRCNPGTPFPDFETAHLHLLRQCIGPDLTQFPSVVRPKLEYGHGTTLPWKRLVTVEQVWETLAPVLRKHFDPEVDLNAIAEKIQPNAIDRYTKNVYEGRINSKRKHKLNLDDHYRPSRGNNKEINLPQTDDNEDDDEDFEERPKDTAAVKRVPCSSKEISTNLVRDQLGITRQEYRDAEDSPTDDANEEQSLNVAWTAVPRSAVHRAATPGMQRLISTKSPFRGSVNKVTVQAKSSNLRTREEPQSIHQQIVNELYEQTCGISTHTIINFYESRNPSPALPNVWKEIWTHRQSNSMWTSGSIDHLPYPRTPSTVSPRSKGTLNVHARVMQANIDKGLRQVAKADLSKFKMFCGEVIVID